MTNEQLHDDEPGPRSRPSTDPLAPDHLLMALVNSANTLDMGVSVTLHVSGLVVSGMLISGSKFFDQVALALRQPAAGESTNAAEAVAEAFEYVAMSYRDEAERKRRRERSEGGNETAPHPVEYIHLQDAVVYAPGGAPLPGTLWRGRLAHVSGWSFGTFS